VSCSKIIKIIKKLMAKETMEQKLAKTAWEKDYMLQPATSTSLFYEYLEMGMQHFNFLALLLLLLLLLSTFTLHPQVKCR
jgi:hypothetical protein